MKGSTASDRLAFMAPMGLGPPRVRLLLKLWPKVPHVSNRPSRHLHAVTHSTILLAGDSGTTSCMLFDQDKSGVWQNGRRALDIGQEVHDVLVSEAPLRGQASCRAC